jgi:hypothetical protein
VDNGSAYVDAWLARACAKLGIRLTHSTPGRPQGRGKIERLFRTVNEQFLVEVADTTAEDLAGQGISQAAALLELNRLFTAWVETVYHTRVHTETEQTPLTRWSNGFRVGDGPKMPTAQAIGEAFQWSQFRTVNRKTATVSLLSNTYQVDPALIGRRVELVFDPFDLSDITVRYHGKQFAKAVPHVIGRHSHPKARPETEQQPPTPTGIDYLNLVAADHHDATGAAINFHALTTPAIPLDTGIDTDAGGGDSAGDPGIEHVPDHADGQVPGQQPLPGMPAPATLTIDGVAS